MGGSSKKQTVGYKYSLGVHMALAHGPFDNVNRIEVDRRLAWEGSVDGGTISINKPNLFGGDQREGGVSGAVDIEMGLPDQTPNTYLQRVLGGAIPAFRGVACAVLNQCYMGNNPYLKPWSFRAKRILKTSLGAEQWYPEAAEIIGDVSTIDSQFCSYACDSIDSFGTQSFEHYWTLKDPQTTSVVPAQFSRATGNKYHIEPSEGVGDAWESGIHRYWTQASSGLESDGLGLCDANGKRYEHSFDTGQQMEFSGFANLEDVRGFWHTAIVTDASGGSDYILDLRHKFDLGGGSEVFDNPRVTVQINTTTKTVRFTGSLQGDQPFIEIPYTHDLPAHVITIFVPAIGYEFEEQSDGVDKHRLTYQYACYVDGELPQTLIQSTPLLSTAIGFTPEFKTTEGFYAFRGGSTSWLGLGIDHTKNNHEGAWLALNANFINFSGGSAGFIPCQSDCADMNPAHIIRECLSDSVWGLGHADTDIDDVAFEAAADALFLEGMGISILWDRQMPIEDFIMEILRHIDAALYVSRTTGKFVLKLIRDDYDSSILVLDESNVSRVTSAKRPALGEMISSVTVNFWDRETGEQASLTEHNWPLRQLQGADNTTTIQYPGFTNYETAQQAALRDLVALSTPLLSCKITVSRAASELYTGDAFILDWPDLDVDQVVMRVNKMTLGNGRSNTIEIEASEDVFYLPAENTTTTPEKDIWVDPINGVDPLEAVARVVTETPYYRLVQEITQLDINNRLESENDAGYLLAAAGRQATELNAQLQIDEGSGFEESVVLDFCPYGYLRESISEVETSVAIRDAMDLDLVNFPEIAQIGDELVRVDSMVEDSSGHILTVGRGILDTVPARHAPDSTTEIPVTFWGTEAVSDDVERTASETLSVKMLPVMGTQVFSSALASSDDVTLDSRAFRPYPPGNLEIDTVSYPEVGGASEIVWSADHTIDWAHRDRLQQTDGNLWDYSAADIGPEPGTAYRIDVYSTLIDTTVTAPWWTVSLGSVTTYTMDSGSAIPTEPANTDTVHIKVTAVRDGYDSWQSPVASLAISGVAPGADPFWPDVHALAKFEDGDASTTVADEAAGTWTVSGASSEVTTDQSKFGTGSFLANGTNGALRLTNPPTLGTGDFTIEFFAAAVQAHQTFGRIFQTANGDITTGLSIVVGGTTQGANVELYASSNGSSNDVINGTEILTAPVADQFYHFVLQRESGVLYCFVDGVLVASAAYAGTFQAGSEWVFGGQSVGTSRNAGWAIDEIRITEDARYSTSGFTPPSAPFPTS